MWIIHRGIGIEILQKCKQNFSNKLYITLKYSGTL